VSATFKHYIGCIACIGARGQLSSGRVGSWEGIWEWSNVYWKIFGGSQAYRSSNSRSVHLCLLG